MDAVYLDSGVCLLSLDITEALGNICLYLPVKGRFSWKLCYETEILSVKNVVCDT